MIVIIGLIGGAALGWWQAARRDGNRMDKAQYAAVYAIIFALVGLILTVAIERLI